jgi:hypothetical protein
MFLRITRISKQYNAFDFLLDVIWELGDGVIHNGSTLAKFHLRLDNCFRVKKGRTGETSVPISARHDRCVGALLDCLLEETLGFADSSRGSISRKGIGWKICGIGGTNTLTGNLTWLGHLQVIANSRTR